MKDVQSATGVGANGMVPTPDIAKPEEGQETLRAVEGNNKLELSREKKEEEGKVQPELFEEVKANLDRLSNVLPVTSTNLSFEFDENGDPPFIRVIDRDSDEVIREIPSEEFREVAKALDEFADKVSGKGVLFDRTA
ncbi:MULTISPECIES: flagellar protein FlaG [Pseudoalteromonas]|uniref:Flagellar protein FlaG n=1 Tax=Pseudoalteromonas obscura TaxID=3048491 RepID=A0ABT7ETN8_9GAMM|nr:MULTISPECIES: flagellar protein FlaG [Pseudoalteromonas]MBQ4836970.1 flagellar protein FlaG [Pseudoalteromonas luteoviolacea]MDK2598411.1 flagellar protein FlaG [Pseudoalteromonas sp. P94(2023)]